MARHLLSVAWELFKFMEMNSSLTISQKNNKEFGSSSAYQKQLRYFRLENCTPKYLLVLSTVVLRCSNIFFFTFYYKYLSLIISDYYKVKKLLNDKFGAVLNFQLIEIVRRLNYKPRTLKARVR